MSFRDRVRLDRYAAKDPHKALEENNLVVASFKRLDEGKEKESREIGTVLKCKEHNLFDVQLANEIMRDMPRAQLEYVVEKSYEEICRRVARAVAQGDKVFEEAVYNAMTEERFVPGGRALAGLGRPDYDLTLYNCNVFGIPEDSRVGIASHWARLFETYSRGGGIGWNLSILRPKGAIVKKVNGRSSGSVSWAEQFSQITGAVEQGGCFAGDVEIYTDKGKILATELADRLDAGEEIQALTHAGYRPITAAFRNGRKPTLEIVVWRTPPPTRAFAPISITVSPEHRMVVACAEDEEVPGTVGTKLPLGTKLVQAQELRLTDQLVCLPLTGNLERTLKYGDKQEVATVVAIQWGEEQDVFDFEVDDVHLICGNGFYTSNSRRGASLQGLEVWHPDIEEFVDVKAQTETLVLPDGQTFTRNRNLISNSNLSVLITNGFMEAVEADSEWQLVFPDLSDPEYDAVWDGDINKWKGLGKKVEVYKTVKARDLWNKVIQRAWEAGEPGLIFLDHANELSNSHYYSRLVAGNPCAEQILPANSVCNLGHINLAKFVKGDDQFPAEERSAAEAGNRVAWNDLRACIRTGVRFLDTVIDLNKYHEKGIEEQQKSERRVGLGFLGYGEMLFRLGLRYGSEEALKFTSRLLHYFSIESYTASSLLAKTHGSFPRFDAEKFLASQFVSNHTYEVREHIARHGMRNVTVNTVAPTGSVGVLLQTTGGCEPYFDLEYTSKTRIGVVHETSPVVQELVDRFGEDSSKWPSYVVTAQTGITPPEYVKTISTIQRWIDSSISNTINLPNSATVEDVGTAYKEMWRLGCKGGTVYRDGSRDEQVLYANKPAPKEPEPAADDTVILPRPDVGLSVTFSEKSPIGVIHTTLRHDTKTGDPIDFFILTNSGDVAADTEAIGRLISLILRWPNDQKVNQHKRLELIRDQLIGIIGREQEGIGPDAKRSLPDTIARIIDKYLAANFAGARIPFGTTQMKELLTALRKLRSDPEAFDKLTEFVLNGKAEEGPVDEYHEEMEVKIRRAEEKGLRLPYTTCPNCSNVAMVDIPGQCGYCRICAHTRC